MIEFIIVIVVTVIWAISQETKLRKTAKENEIRFANDPNRQKIKELQAERDAKIEEINARYRKQDAEFWERYNQIGK